MGTLFGFVIGYVLGARAGNPGYERVRQAWSDLQESREFREFLDAIRTHAQGTLRTVSDRLDDGAGVMMQGEELLARARQRVQGFAESEPD